MLSGYILRYHYKIVRQLGSGSFGTTYLAEDIDLPDNPPRVVKCLHKSQNPQELKDFITFFNKEAKALYRLGNECDQIPRLFAHFEEAGEFYLVQEYVNGHDLSKEIYPGNRLSEDQVRQLLKEVLEVLKFIHDRNIIHRDVKAQNLMRRCSDDKIVLIDFGTVKEISKLTANSQYITNASVVVGTSGYMPNEQLNGYPKLCSDIYAVGMLGIYALTGIRPQDLPKNSENFEVIWQDKVSISPHLAGVLDRMVRSNFKERYQNANEALQALQITSDEPTTGTIRIAPPASPKPSPRFFLLRNKNIFIIFGILAGLVFGVRFLLTFISEKPELITDPKTCLEKISSLSFETEPPEVIDIEGNRLYKPDGKIKNKKLNGCGALVKRNRDTYQGMFKNNNLNGEGILFYGNGNKYYGSFRRNKLHGQGRLIFYNRDRYEGGFKNNQYHGQGILTFANGNRYEGEFEYGNLDGQGTWTSVNPRYIYTGEYRNNKKHGQGKLIYGNGCIQEGKFENDKFYGEKTCTPQNNTY